MKPADKALFASWIRAFIAGVLTLYLAGEMSPKKLLAAGIAGVVPPIMRWLNPNDQAFGRSNGN